QRLVQIKTASLCFPGLSFKHGRNLKEDKKNKHHCVRVDEKLFHCTLCVCRHAGPVRMNRIQLILHNSVWRRAKLSERGIRVGLLALVVGTYARFVRHFLYSAENHFLPGQMVTYYILTDNPRTLDPPVELGPGRQMKVLPAAELPGWHKLAYRRMVLFAEALWDSIGKEVDYIFCADVDQEFVGPVGEEILGDLVATLHPEFFEMPRSNFPYEDQEESSACVEEDEGDYYYTSEFYGGVVSQMRRLARECSLLILQDEANKVMAKGLEESYLNRYLIDHRPTCVLSPEYSWWDSPLTAHVIHALSMFSIKTNPSVFY
uniref:Uncharacterized protein n=1 Tax=Poecilia reticulata TaxID=8081 RepID=A0A3P9QAC2_POERE